MGFFLHVMSRNASERHSKLFFSTSLTVIRKKRKERGKGRKCCVALQGFRFFGNVASFRDHEWSLDDTKQKVRRSFVVKKIGEQSWRFKSSSPSSWAALQAFKLNLSSNSSDKKFPPSNSNFCSAKRGSAWNEPWKTFHRTKINKRSENFLCHWSPLWSEVLPVPLRS